MLTEQQQQDIRDMAKELQQRMSLQAWEIKIYFVNQAEIDGLLGYKDSQGCNLLNLIHKESDIYISTDVTLEEAANILKHEISHIYTHRLSKYLDEILPAQVNEIIDNCIEELTEDISKLL